MKNLVVAILATLLVAGCTSKLDQIKEAGQKPLNAAQIRELVQGNTFHIHGGRWQWAGYYKPDGTKVGKEWWSGGGRQGSGTWEVTDDGKMCGQWSEQFWAGGRYGCWLLYRDGDEIITEPVSGGDNKSNIVKMVPGNPYNL